MFIESAGVPVSSPKLIEWVFNQTTRAIENLMENKGRVAFDPRHYFTNPYYTDRDSGRENPRPPRRRRDRQGEAEVDGGGGVFHRIYAVLEHRQQLPRWRPKAQDDEPQRTRET